MDKCRSCGADIIWHKTAKGKAIPLDVRPVENGNIIIDEGVAHVLAAGIEPVGKLRWVSHFATCPNAAKHRKAK